jgi:uncharacterized membrane protein
MLLSPLTTAQQVYQMDKRKIVYLIIVVALIATSLVLVFLDRITYGEALQGAAVWASVIFGIYERQMRKQIEKQLEAMREEYNQYKHGIR